MYYLATMMYLFVKICFTFSSLKFRIEKGCYEREADMK